MEQVADCDAWRLDSRGDVDYPVDGSFARAHLDHKRERRSDCYSRLRRRTR